MDQQRSSSNHPEEGCLQLSNDCGAKRTSSVDGQVVEVVRTTAEADGSSSDSGVSCQHESSDSLEEKAASESRTSDDDDGEESGSSKRTGKTGKKRDRSNLRKGKWSAEEEAYTSRIIHYFSQGLLTLPEGSTLRSYLADKLNCDPMRITKKYAGASCLGRRVLQYRDGTQPTIAAIQIAKAELDHLEQRFRMRVEEGHSHVSLPSHPDMVLSISQHVNNLMLPNGPPASTNLTAFPVLGHQSLPQSPSVPWPIAGAQPSGQWLLPSTPAPTTSGIPAPQATSEPKLPSPNDSATNWAFAQIAASLAPAISQLAAAKLLQDQQPSQPATATAQTPQGLTLPISAAFSIPGVAPQPQVPVLPQQKPQDFAQQLQKTFEEHLKATGNQVNVEDQSRNFAKRLQETYAEHLRTNNIQVHPTSQATSVPAKLPPPVTASIPISTSRQLAPAQAIRPVANLQATQPRQVVGPGPTTKRQRTEEDKAAGNILLGLRQSYEDALNAQQQRITLKTPQTGTNNNETTGEAAVVTDSSAQQVDSSVEEDYDCSSEDSSDSPNVSKGPPRKRIKASKQNKSKPVSN